MSDSMTARFVRFRGYDGDEVEAYLASPDGGGPRGGVVVIHHLPGFDRGTKEIVRRFATLGYDAICPSLYWREAPGAAPDDAAALARSRGGVPDARLVGDVAGAAGWLRGLETSNGRVGVIGYCSGGRQSVLAACSVDVDAAVDCYGAFVTGTPPAGYPLPVTNLVDLLPRLRAPLLGLFGREDSSPSPEHVAELDRILTRNAKPHEFHSYDGAGHAFFAVDRPAYRVAAATDGSATGGSHGVRRPPGARHRGPHAEHRSRASGRGTRGPDRDRVDRGVGARSGGGDPGRPRRQRSWVITD
jgi:carboxymethylenebutenolidase